ISDSTPADGAGTSIVTLSVSSSTSGSSTATASPAFLNHLPMVASVTDSPRVGTRISVMAPILESIRSKFRRRSAERALQQGAELGEVLGHDAARGRRRGGPAGVARPSLGGTDLVEHPFEIGLDEAPRAHVARLLLAPHQLRALEAAELLHERLDR